MCKYKLGSKVICKGVDADFIKEFGFDIDAGHEYYISRTEHIKGIDYYHMIDNNWEKIRFFNDELMLKWFDTEKELRRKKLKRLSNV